MIGCVTSAINKVTCSVWDASVPLDQLGEMRRMSWSGLMIALTFLWRGKLMVSSLAFLAVTSILIWFQIAASRSMWRRVSLGAIL